MSSDNTIVTKVGRGVHGENYFRGHAALGELAGRADIWSLFSLSVGGQILSEKESRILDMVAAVLLVPEPRLWIFKVPRMIASYGQTLCGLAAGQLVLEGAIIGPRWTGEAVLALEQIKAQIDPETAEAPRVRDVVATHLERQGKLPGYGVPGREVDERSEFIHEWYSNHGFPDGPNWSLYEKVREAVRDLKGLRPNIGAAMAPVWLDLGYSPKQAFYMSNFAVQINSMANAFEGAEQQAEILREVPDVDIEYTGPEPRKSPRAKKSD